MRFHIHTRIAPYAPTAGPFARTSIGTPGNDTSKTE
jgi:hypothetical protein